VRARSLKAITPGRIPMNAIVYIVGLVVVVGAVIAFIT
jgi:hypothetical protein